MTTRKALKPSEKRALAEAEKVAKSRAKAGRPSGRSSPLTPVFKHEPKRPAAKANVGPMLASGMLASEGIDFVLAHYSPAQIRGAMQLKAAIVSDAFADLAAARGRVQGLLGGRRR